MRIMQMADVHLDCAFSGVLEQDVRNKLRDEQLEAFRTAVLHARNRSVDIVLIPGDLFEHNRTTIDTIRFVQQELGQLSAPVFIAPGNHDPYLHDSLYLTTDWPSNVKVFTGRSFEAFTLPDKSATIFGVANLDTKDERSPFEGFYAEGPGFKIGRLHGTCLDTIPPSFADVRCLPFNIQDLIDAGFDYTALGHLHTFCTYPSTERPVASYSGCLRSSGFDEEGEKGLLIVDLDDENTTVEFLASNCSTFRTVDIDLGHIDNTDQVVAAVRGLADQNGLSESILRVRLRGEIDPEIDLCLETIERQVADSFLYVALDGSGLRIGYDLDAIAEQDNVAGKLVQKVRNIPLDSPERALSERAMYYALDALYGREVRRS